MQRLREQLLGIGFLDDLAEIEHRHAMAEKADGAEIVGDEQIGRAEFTLQPDRKRSTISARAVGSSAEVGSSSMISCGLVTMARPMPTRCCWPALNSAGNWSSTRSAKTKPHDDVARARARGRLAIVPDSAGARPCVSPTRIRGSSDSAGSWNTSWMRPRISLRADVAAASHRLAVEPDLARGRLDQTNDSAAEPWFCRNRIRRRAPAFRRDSMVKSTPLTACTTLREPTIGNSFTRFCTSSSALMRQPSRPESGSARSARRQAGDRPAPHQGSASAGARTAARRRSRPREPFRPRREHGSSARAIPDCARRRRAA